jgi:hypothetical protein
MTSHAFYTRIITDVSPSLKKIGSNNENQEQAYQSVDNVPSNKPKSLHHRPNNSKSSSPE